MHLFDLFIQSWGCKSTTHNCPVQPAWQGFLQSKPQRSWPIPIG